MEEKTQAALSAFKMTAAEFNRQDTTTHDLKQVEQELADSKIGLEFWGNKAGPDSAASNSFFTPTLAFETVTNYASDPPKGVPGGAEICLKFCQLGWAKLNDRWQLAVRYGFDWLNHIPDDFSNFDDYGFLETSRQPLAQATRTIRVKAAAALPDFLQAFDKRVKEYSKDTQE